MRTAALLVLWLLGAAPALALSHLQANRIRLFNPGQCAKPTGPLWITIGTGQPAPGFINVNPPGFDEIGALVSGAVPGTPEATLAGQTPTCGVIASFYENATPVGAWVVPADKLPQLLSILRLNG
ncbi:hypothetical protein [Acidocella sp.]|uniref:hypothetical protein n=1 Tax=Acidocella sp. TaxID=50710 RepID=UPI003D08CD70